MGDCPRPAREFSASLLCRRNLRNGSQGKDELRIMRELSDGFKAQTIYPENESAGQILFRIRPVPLSAGAVWICVLKHHRTDWTLPLCSSFSCSFSSDTAVFTIPPFSVSKKRTPENLLAVVPVQLTSFSSQSGTSRPGPRLDVHPGQIPVRGDLDAWRRKTQRYESRSD